MDGAGKAGVAGKRPGFLNAVYPGGKTGKVRFSVRPGHSNGCVVLTELCVCQGKFHTLQWAVVGHVPFLNVDFTLPEAGVDQAHRLVGCCLTQYYMRGLTVSLEHVAGRRFELLDIVCTVFQIADCMYAVYGGKCFNQFIITAVGAFPVQRICAAIQQVIISHTVPIFFEGQRALPGIRLVGHTYRRVPFENAQRFPLDGDKGDCIVICPFNDNGNIRRCLVAVIRIYLFF